MQILVSENAWARKLVDILIPKKYTKFDHLKNAESTGRKRGLVGSHILDLADLKKVIVLCEFCRRGFNLRQNHYQQHKTIPFVQGQCDACKNHFARAYMFAHESLNY